MDNKLIVTAAPHITSADSTQKIMGKVCLALVPTLIVSIFIFGVGSLVVTAVTVAACVFFEWAYCKLMGREIPIADFSAVVTGLLLAFNMPATLPWWMAIVGAFIAIVIIKQLFGGLGYNFANPAIVGRIALAVGYGGAMSAFPMPANQVDALTSATPLAVAGELGAGDYVTLLLGQHGGVLGETCAITILIGGIYLIATKVISPMIPAAYLATVAVMSFCFGMDPIVQLLSGGLMLGAFFMATDYATSPVTKKGQLIFGVGCGLFTVLIRYFGSYNEGVCYSIMVMNLFVPFIDKYTKPVRFGVVKSDKKEGAAK